MIDLRNQAAIVGFGYVPFGKRGQYAERGHLRLVIEAITAACADAGITPRDVDGYSSYYTPIDPPDLAEAFGAPRLRYASQAWGGGGAAMCGAFHNAAMAVAGGTVRPSSASTRSVSWPHRGASPSTERLREKRT